MKKLVLLLISITLISCGGDKKKEVIENVEVAKDKYSIILDGVYEKDDSIAVFYQVDGYFKYDKPVSLKIKGSTLAQRFTIELPQDIAIENLSIVASTNKTQDFITVKNISLLNNNLSIFNGENYKHSEYLLTDNSFSWDAKNIRYNLNHNNKYPPSFSGNDKLISLLAK